MSFRRAFVWLVRMSLMHELCDDGPPVGEDQVNAFLRDVRALATRYGLAFYVTVEPTMEGMP